jgi:hypothetical protein
MAVDGVTLTIGVLMLGLGLARMVTSRFRWFGTIESARPPRFLIRRTPEREAEWNAAVQKYDRPYRIFTGATAIVGGISLIGLSFGLRLF